MSESPKRSPLPELEDGPDKKESGVQPVAARKRDRRRRHSRVEVQLIPVEVLVEGADDPVSGRCVNLSLGGMFILLKPPPKHGASLRVWLNLPTGDRLMVTGTVRWSTGEGVGIQHELLGARDTFLLTQYLASLKAIEEPDDDED